ncbi:MAG: hypothetical protein AAFV88_09015 [Planctomycetota bacterium]
MNLILQGRIACLAISASLLASGIASAQYPLSGDYPSPANSIPANSITTVSEDEVATGTSLFETTRPSTSVFQQPFERPRLSEEKPRQLLGDNVASSSDMDSKPTAAEMRQARAIYRSQQRIARMERNLWAGYEPLRPSWNSIPMMSSRYPAPRTVVVPFYYWAR